MTAATPRQVRCGRHAFWVADDQPTFWDRVEVGAWEPGTLATLDGLLGPGTVLLDLGAWVGPLTLYAAAGGARVVAAEADPRALDQLRRNLAANPDLAARVTVLDRAVAVRPGLVRLGARRKPGDSMSSTLLAQSEGGWTAEGITAGELAALVAPGEALVVTLDIEGGEYALLPSLGPLLDRDRCAILVALHPAILRESGVGRISEATAAALAILAGWRCFAITPTGPVPHDPALVPGAEGAEWLFVREDRAIPENPGRDSRDDPSSSRE